MAEMQGSNGQQVLMALRLTDESAYAAANSKPKLAVQHLKIFHHYANCSMMKKFASCPHWCAILCNAW